MQGHAAIEHDRRRSDSKSVSELADEEVSGGNIVDVGYGRVAGDNVAGRDESGRDAKALQENYGSQDHGGGGRRPDVEDHDIGGDQEQHSEDERADGSQAGNKQRAK